MTTREGGVSAGPFRSFNLSFGVGDDPTSVTENRRRLSTAIDAAADPPRLLRQVHGARIVKPPEAPAEADGFLVRAGDPWVAVTAADCAAVAIVAAGGARGVLLHAGWRGARSGIVRRGVAALVDRAVTPEDLLAVVGPCLHACCFPVGADVATLFHEGVLRPHPSGQASLDLPAAIHGDLVSAGIPPGSIGMSDLCTSCEGDRFYSHRRDRGLTGRHWALLRLWA